MSEIHHIPVETLRQQVTGIFRNAGMTAANAAAVADVITDAERDSCKSHGIYRIEGCLRVIAAGRASPDAIPRVLEGDTAIIEVEAKGGFSNPAFEAARATLAARARKLGLAALVIRDCLHFSALWHDVEVLAGEGLAALSMCPSYAFVAPAGGTKPLLGTNPMAFGWPRPKDHPYVYDFATSMVARGEIELHRQAGKPIPEGWAIDAEGHATTDPEAALAGSMLTFGGHKGSAISTMIELLSGAMLGEIMSKEALEATGGKAVLPRHGALILAFSPEVFARRSGRDPLAEGERLLQAFNLQGARLPSQRRFAARALSLEKGVPLTTAEVDRLAHFREHGLRGLET
ncbi:Ldh family oxidoreductase [Pseudoroseicyclus aestuarii]|uniref:LDH2 family malate/lactate/ureidoglycolate dehydrogenase n=1 Tax=Pseudoroseicyclus aestuarii TaxID=1795041 RepID=A0A318SV74_9RHOB|nr:Ldh family oxidoreductase [Pseudoroseicyclus aestuarii]PYE85513.1 LDH2 family malate/lactate/ureidoglycolate dehydrogenase [Pseudoroseicyclus aestuarii]